MDFRRATMTMALEIDEAFYPLAKNTSRLVRMSWKMAPVAVLLGAAACAASPSPPPTQPQVTSVPTCRLPASDPMVYFSDDALLDSRTHVDNLERTAALRKSWGSRLISLQEPPLACAASSNRRVARLLYLPSFGPFIAIRIEQLAEGAVVVATTNHREVDTAEPALRNSRVVRLLSPSESDKLTAAFQINTFASLTKHEPRAHVGEPQLQCFDGTGAVIELRESTSYQVVARRCDVGPITAFVELFFEAAGLPAPRTGQ